MSTQVITTPVTIDLLTSLFQQLEKIARQKRQTVPEVVQEIVLRELPTLPSLPADVEAELVAFHKLSDDVLWLLARSSLTTAEQNELAYLNQQSKKRPLTLDEASRQQSLLDSYDRTMICRAQAALLLKQRGYDLSDPNILQSS